METRHLISINVTDDKNGSILDDTPFTTARLTPETRKRFNEASKNAVKIFMKETKLPLLIAGYVLFALGFICVGGFLKALPDVGLSTALRNGKWILLAGIILGGVGLILMRTHKKIMNRDREQTAEEAAAGNALENVSQMVEAELGTPSEEETTDVEALAFEYKIKSDGSVKENLTAGCYGNTPLSLWREEETLCLTDYDCVMKIPVSAFEGYYTVHEKYKISIWYKDEECDKGPYAAYGIKEDNEGNYLLSTYYRVMIRNGEERYEMRIPCYDFPAFRELVDIPCLDRTAEG